MNEQLLKKATLMLLLLITTGVLIVQEGKSKISNDPLVHHINGDVQIYNCGCYFQFPKDTAKSNRYVFFEDFSVGPPLMNIDGKNVNLKLVASTEPSDGVKKKGEQFNRSYVSGNVKIYMDFVTTSVCNSNDEGCEATNYDVTITVTKGKRRQTLNAVGGCGC